ncbi:FtsX-like permease family protein [Enterococcus ureasiticus]|uniref:ABC3 transporter permease C-terminal domain-containing protein n=1 Tax=Enterococcus ureasiticus TaxID=903984 RepID=A0A1E5GNJ1_9ENTE|nr:FtsX-like permease family protein [Enterococcus ureasiticus]OEG14266.1 hypothetical protein BCR21_04555 [Enterococcus ureasiticus]
MYALYYVLKDSGNNLLQNKVTALLKSIFSFLYFFVLTTLLHGWLTAIHLEEIEQKRILEEADSMDILLQSNSNEQLLTLLKSLKTAFLIFSIGLFLFGILYLFLYFQRAIILDKKELILKKMLGASALQVTSELFIESMLLTLPSCILSLFTAESLYTLFFQSSDSWLTSILYPPSYFVIYVDFSLIGLFSLLLICQFLYLKQKLTNL